tara:strand:- start:16210 stop:17124 length:915 start_codon:yes stop_codon:yes gene_type:complete
MKKLSPLLLLILVALLIGFVVGLYSFKQEPISKRPRSVLESAPQSLTDEEVTFEQDDTQVEEVEIKKIKSEMMSELWQAYDDLIVKLVLPGNKSCMQALGNLFQEKDYIDPNQTALRINGSYDQAVNLLNDILNTVQTSEVIHELNLKLLYNPKTDPQKLQGKMSESTICSDVKITNFTNALIKDIARARMEPDERNELTRKFIDIAHRYLYSASSVEYTSSAMEILFSLSDNELIPRANMEELAQLRQTLIGLIQNYESDFRPQGAPLSNLEVMQDFYQELNQFNTSILDIIERLRYEIPKGR